MLRGFLRVWVASARRRVGSLLILPAGVIIFVAFLSRDTASLPVNTGSPRSIDALNILILTAIAVVAFVPVIVRGKRLTAARRFDLLPLSRPQRMILRILLDMPLGPLLALPGVVITSVVVARSVGGPHLLILAHVFQLTAAFTIAVLTMDLTGNHLGTRYPNLVFWPTLFAALLALQVFVAFPTLVRQTGNTGAIDARWLVRIAITPGGPLIDEYLLACGLALTAALMARVDMIIPAQPLRTPAPHPSRSSGGLVRWFPASDAIGVKERAYILRPYISRNAVFVSSAIVLFSDVMRQPLIMLFAFGFWLLFSQNLFGYDFPLHGTTRYRLLPFPLTRIVHAREFAMWLVMLIIVTVLSVPGLLFGPLERWLFMWPFFLFGSGLFLAAALLGRFTSIRSPRPLHRRSLIVHGGTVSPMGYIAISAVTMVGITAVFLVYSILGNWMSRDQFAVGLSVAVIGLCLILTYLLVKRWEQRHGRLWVGGFPARGGPRE